MGVLGGQRILGPISSQAGGESIPSSGGGGGGSVTINNNVDGYLVKATGVGNTLTGLSALTFDGSTFTSNATNMVANGNSFTANTDLYVSGSSNNLFINGTNNAGIRRKFRIDITAGILQIVEIEGS
tara:strand:- start:76 stop:456 length:381 start_codon:yes stop_codon:yes gene_type:complete